MRLVLFSILFCSVCFAGFGGGRAGGSSFGGSRSFGASRASSYFSKPSSGFGGTRAAPPSNFGGSRSAGVTISRPNPTVPSYSSLIGISKNCWSR